MLKIPMSIIFIYPIHERGSDFTEPFRDIKNAFYDTGVNIVPEYAKVWIWIRDLDRAGVKVVVEKVEKIVEGSAIAKELKD